MGKRFIHQSCFHHLFLLFYFSIIDYNNCKSWLLNAVSNIKVSNKIVFLFYYLLHFVEVAIGIINHDVGLHSLELAHDV